jgi:hypothetical protein
MEGDLTLQRIVHISGLAAEDPRLEELRKIGLDKATVFKRVRHELPGFEGPYVMVQVLPELSVRRALNSGSGVQESD